MIKGAGTDRLGCGGSIAPDSPLRRVKAAAPGEPSLRQLGFGAIEGRVRRDQAMRLQGFGGREEPEVGPSKRMRLGATSFGGPSCQVDDCSTDLSKAKEYHRRHRVCEAHSKASKAMVGGVLQRFCQQCSRFQLLLEFDEGKRSCRRRLEGHNQRRRKIHSEESSAHLVLTEIQQNHDVGNSELINMLTILAQSQDGSRSTQMSMTSVPQFCQLAEPMTNNNDNQHLTLDLLSILSSTPKASDDAATTTSCHVSSESKDIDNHDKIYTELTEQCSEENSSMRVRPIISVLNNSGIHSSLGSADQPVQKFRTLQLFSPSTNEHPDLQSSRNGMVTTSSMPEFLHAGSLEGAQITNACAGQDSRSDTLQETESHIIEIFTIQKEFPSPYISPYPSKHCYDSQRDRTDRIIFKLFDKEPSNFPTCIRKQILDWLSLSPSDIESYMRPGCVILSIYLSMPSTDWDKLYVDLLPRVELLIQNMDSDFWRSSNFLIHLNQQILSHHGGSVHLLRYDKTWDSPELLVVSPLAIEGGRKTNISLRGRNLRIPGTKIHCTHMGGYNSKEVDIHERTNNDSYSEQFVISERSAGVYGRCFIEVENNLRGNAFPIIIADDNICQELRTLEVELEGVRNDTDLNYSDQDEVKNSRDDIIQFLNDLGWLFQRNSMQSGFLFKDYSCLRFKSLLLFAMERDWCALVKKILDIVVVGSFNMKDLTHQYFDVLGEIQLLSQAVRRKNIIMVDMLLNYSTASMTNAAKVYLFLPDIPGLGGITPLHMAAFTDNSEEVVGSLTNDPQEIGLRCWNSLLDHSGMTPFAYARQRNNHSYNNLVERKIAARGKQTSIMLEEGNKVSSTLDELDQPGMGPMKSSCAQCAVLESNVSNRTTFCKGVLYRPFIHSLLAISTVCLCVSVLFRGAPDIDSIAPFKWSVIEFGIM